MRATGISSTTNSFSFCRTGLLALSVAFFSFGCNEKKPDIAAPTASESPSDGGDDTGSTDGDPSTSFDLCKEGLKDAGLDSAFDDLIGNLCDDGDLAEMRRSANIYSGGSTTKVVKDYTKQTSEETALKIRTSAIIDTTPKDYYNLVRLQFSKPEKIRGADDDCEKPDPFVCDKGVRVSGISASGSTIKYNYENVGDEQGGRVYYSASSKFKTILTDKAYVVATQKTEDEDAETITKLLGLILISVKGSKTEVITISRQAYSHTAEEKAPFNSQLSNGLDAEQKRSYKNGLEAAAATTLMQ